MKRSGCCSTVRFSCPVCGRAEVGWVDGDQPNSFRCPECSSFITYDKDGVVLAKEVPREKRKVLCQLPRANHLVAYTEKFYPAHRSSGWPVRTNYLNLCPFCMELASQRWGLGKETQGSREESRDASSV